MNMQELKRADIHRACGGGNSTERAHHRAGAKELVPPDLIERRARMLHHVKFIRDDRRLGLAPAR